MAFQKGNYILFNDCTKICTLHIINFSIIKGVKYTVQFVVYKSDDIVLYASMQLCISTEVLYCVDLTTGIYGI